MRRPQYSFDYLGRQKSIHLGVIIVAVMLLCYAMPTCIEFIAAHYVNMWFAVILPGDLIGCLCLAAFRMQRTGALLYLSLTVGESLLYTSHAISVPALTYIVDLVPTIVISGMIVRSRLTNMARFALPQ